MRHATRATVLRCTLCDKPFDTEISLKRHGYYCRSRRGAKRPKLPRSCVLCARAKVRCDKTTPACAKCVRKKVDCQYPLSELHAAELMGTQQDRSRCSTQPTLQDSSSLSEVNRTDNPRVNQSSELFSDPNDVVPYYDMVDDNHSWNNSSNPITDYSAPNSFNLGGHQVTSMMVSNVAIASTTAETPMQGLLADSQLGTDIDLMSICVELPRYTIFNVRSLWTLSRHKGGARNIANNMARILYSYPKMLLDLKTLPPFIHPQWIYASNTEAYLEPLANCMNLLGMLSTRARGTASLFWRNVRMECDRLSSTYTTFNKQGLLAASQALLIYLLVRVTEGETEHNNHDAAMLGTLTLILGAAKKQLQSESLEKSVCEKTWSDWIFEESRRRLATILRIIDMLVCIEPASTCEIQTDILIAPLPSRRQLWEADSEERWLHAIQSGAISGGGFGLAKDGLLAALDEYQVKRLSMGMDLDAWTPSRDDDNWGEWCAHSLGDSIGTLIMLAASLPN